MYVGGDKSYDGVVDCVLMMTRNDSLDRKMKKKEKEPRS